MKPLKNPLLRRLVQNSGYLLSSSTLAAALSMVQSILAARLLGVAGFGVLGTIIQFVTVVNRLTSFRMTEVVVKFVGGHQARGEAVQAGATFKAAGITEAASSVLAFVLVGLLAPWAAAKLVHMPEAAPLILAYGLVLLFNLISESAQGLLAVTNQFRQIAAFNLTQSALTLLLVGGAYAAKLGLPAVLGAYLIGKVVAASCLTVAAWVQARRLWGGGWWRLPLTVLRSERRPMTSFAINTNLNGTLNLITHDSELLWLSALSTPTQAGYYKLGMAILNLILIPVDSLINPTYREVAREVATRQWSNVRYLLRSGSVMAAAYSLTASIVLVIFGEQLIAALWGPEFLPTSYDVLLILLLGAFAANTLYWARRTLLALGFPGFPTLVNLVAAVLKVGFTLALVPAGGAVAMAAILSAYFAVTSTVIAGKVLLIIRRQSDSDTAREG
ncbi:MAG: oligosaccharide flippase family protein [Anaerolineales bacterium]|nr:oligosaccharide flippase family protein [Anaerolineales bacterium]